MGVSREQQMVRDEKYAHAARVIEDEPAIQTRELAKKVGISSSTASLWQREILQRLDSRRRAVSRPLSALGGDETRALYQVDDGVILVGSDAHYLPGEPTVAHRAFIEMVRTLRPKMIVQNGDLFDFAQISRHPPIRWTRTHTVAEEIDAVRERLAEIEAVSRGALLHRTWGNHDLRFESRLATVASEYRGLRGTRLADHIPGWTESISLLVNNDVMIKHRYHGGVHAARNNTLKAGLTTVTGHLHQLKVTPVTDYRGTRYGVDTGTLADPGDPQFEYAEDNPRDWRSGFAVLTFRGGRLLWPELAYVEGGRAYFRGEEIA